MSSFSFIHTIRLGPKPLRVNEGLRVTIYTQIGRIGSKNSGFEDGEVSTRRTVAMLPLAVVPKASGSQERHRVRRLV